MTLGEYIAYLGQKNPDTKVAIGLGNPHSWRGSYDELAFEPVENTTIGEMLREAKKAVHETYEGWKGGEYTMSLHTKINIDYIGSYSSGSLAMTMLLDLITKT